MSFQLAVPNLKAQAAPSSGPKLPSRGSPAEKIWLVAEKPLDKDANSGFLFSSPMGWSYDKLLREAGITSYYTTYFTSEAEADAELEKYKPPIIVALDSAAMLLTKHMRKKEDLSRLSGSLLASDRLSFPHYIIPTLGPIGCMSDWTERQVVKYVDYGKVRSELDYFGSNGFLQPLPQRNLETNLPLARVLDKLHTWTKNPAVPFLSIDIENIYPKGNSNYRGHPGYPICIGIAPSPDYGISFSLWPEDKSEARILWKVLANLLAEAEIIGQNFFGFDAWFFEMLGMPPDRFKIHDTMFRHALLWPELSHKLEFLTRQYTRQPYYKDEGKNWSLKDLRGLMRYNALDVTVTYEVFLEQEKEFDERPHLR